MRKTSWLLILLSLLPGAAIAQETIGELPVQHQGRIKPLDTFARVHLLAFSSRRSPGGATPEQWLLDVLTHPDGSSPMRVFKIRSPEVVVALGLPEREDRVYTYSEMVEAIGPQEGTLRELMQREEEDRTYVENQLVESYRNVLRYQEISRAASCLLPLIRIEDAELAAELDLPSNRNISYRTLVGHFPAIRGRLDDLGHLPREQWSDSQKALVRLVNTVNRLQEDRFAHILAIVPPGTGTEVEEAKWLSPWEIVGTAQDRGLAAEILDGWEALLSAHRDGDRVRQAEATVALHAAIRGALPDSRLQRIDLENWYNRTDLFYKSVALYILAFLLLATSWMFASRWLRPTALGALGFGVALHIAGLVCRMVIMGRAPVSTLYESIVFVGMVSALTGVVVELMRRDGYGILLGAIAGAILHFVGFGKAADGDTMGMLVAVLNSNFWLSTHVVTITIGYGCSLVAGLAGHLYLVFRAFRPSAKARLEVLNRNMGGLTLVALFFTLFGTILGGIWADQSWGRFWGWDPKENGALLIVMWQLMLLHGRYTALFRPRGFAFGLVLNNIIVALAWFGVNLLNIGLHTYGFAGNVATNLAIFCGIELVFGLVFYGLAYRRGQQEARA
ncbi:MAG: cytochrome c biogenesis protein CcsA [Acidobacteriota bacterium]|nr:cytochrome c biogenesis protein CcsA [Acidobacteriota bacterium]MDQ7088627.1 cytochrome c biogenesis protein CcsA [Acidobacteriota bacterium]